MRDGAEDGGINVWLFVLQSTPVGSLQTGHEMVVSPNRDRHPTASKVYISLLYLKERTEYSVCTGWWWGDTVVWLRFV